MPPTIDFPNIRPHQDSRDRAFEELCFQLLPELEKLPPGATVVRNGTPDGGVEFRAVLPNGDQWAWQAKYLFELGGSEFGQLDRSIRTALISQPRLTRYTFCLPYNRPDSSAPHQKSAMQRWNEHCRKWAGWASARGMSLEIGYVGESELLAALTQPGEAGRARYWFDTMILTPAWIRDRLKEALATAGPRYTPELSIDLPIASVFDGLGRSGELQRRIRAALGAVHRSLGWFSVRDGPPLDDQIKALKVTCDDELERLRTAAMGIDVTGTGWQDFEGLGAACAAARNACEEIWEAVRDRRERLTHPASSGSGRPREFERERYAWDSAAWHVRQTVNAVDELSQLAASDAARLVNLPCLLVTGRPGAGKTHLLCDVAKRRCDAGQATLVLHGEAFTRDEPWSQIRNRLHVACELDEFLGALDAAAEANGGRSLIFLDALNDGDGQVLWPKYLAGFIEKLRHWPRLGLAVSCRTSYVEAVLPPGLDAAAELVQVEHRGFAGFEYKAAKSFFDHYGLQLPDFPLLVPEFQNPLFLKLMCRGLQSRGFVTMPRGTFGVSAIFEGYLSAANDRLSDPERCDYRREDRLVERAMEAIAEEMLSTGQDWMDWARLTRIVDALLPGREYSRSLSRGLLNEGLLVADRGRRFGNAEAVLFSYQRLGDHQLASEFCQRAGSKDALIAECRRITSDESTAWRHSGLLEALAVQLPERFDVEIYEVVTRPDSSVVRRAFLESLVWRDTAAFPSDVSGYLQATAESLGHEPVLESVLQVACIPEHPYNAGWLHGILWGVPMAQRDAWWSIFVHNYGSDEAVVARIIDWAWSDGPLRASAESALLCATALAWFLTTPNRYMRDRATKGIVNLLKAKPETLAALLQRFHGVNDPYVAERLYAAAYAICLTSSDRETVRTVAEAVYVRVFEDCRPPVHVLLRDYARGTIERAASLGCVLQGVDLASVRPPY